MWNKAEKESEMGKKNESNRQDESRVEKTIEKYVKCNKMCNIPLLEKWGISCTAG